MDTMDTCKMHHLLYEKALAHAIEDGMFTIGH